MTIDLSRRKPTVNAISCSSLSMKTVVPNYTLNVWPHAVNTSQNTAKIAETVGSKVTWTKLVTHQI